MADEELITLLKEIRDLQKIQIANSQEAVKIALERATKAQKRLPITLGIFILVVAIIACLPYLLAR